MSGRDWRGGVYAVGGPVAAGGAATAATMSEPLSEARDCPRCGGRASLLEARLSQLVRDLVDASDALDAVAAVATTAAEKARDALDVGTFLREQEEERARWADRPVNACPSCGRSCCVEGECCYGEGCGVSRS